MKDAKIGEKLPMERMRTEETDDLGFNLERLLASEASVAAGRFRPLDGTLSELRSRYHS